jgi:hypothetical protein
MKARHSAMSSSAPLNLPLASLVAERHLLYPPQRTTLHLLKAESHFCSDVNEAVDGEQDSNAKLDATALAAVPGIYIHLDPNSEYPFRWHKDLVRAKQCDIDLLLHQHHKVKVDPEVVASAALPIGRLLSVQVSRVMALRGGSLPVLVNLLRDRDHVTSAWDVTPAKAADCYLCPHQAYPETERHLFECRALAEEFVTLTQRVQASLPLRVEDAELVAQPHIMHTLSAGLAPAHLLRSVPAAARQHQMTILQKAAVAGFTGLWRARCHKLHEHCETLPADKKEARWMSYLRVQTEAELTPVSV